jgi:hypothetical protein
VGRESSSRLTFSRARKKFTAPCGWDSRLHTTLKPMLDFWNPWQTLMRPAFIRILAKSQVWPFLTEKQGAE